MAVKWPSNTHRPSFSIIPIAKSITAQAGMLFENGMGNGNINPRPAITMPKPIWIFFGPISQSLAILLIQRIE
jgi:hypothetical protein